MKPLFDPDPPEGWREIPKALHYVFLDRGFAWPSDPEVLRHRPKKDYRPDRLRARYPLMDFINFNAYVGVVPLLLVPFAFVSRGRWVHGLAAAFTVLLFLSLSDPIGRTTGFFPWQRLRELPVLGTLRTSGRFLAVAVAALSILSAFGLRELSRRWRPAGSTWAGVFGVLVLFATAADYGTRNAQILSLAFPYAPRAVEPAPAFSTYLLPVYGFDYATVRARVGARAGHSNLFLKTGVVPRGHPAYRGEAYLLRGGDAQVADIRPNAIEVEVSSPLPDTLVVNQGYLSGWSRRDREGEVFSASGRIATEVSPEDGRVQFEYRPRRLGTGLALSALSLVGLAALAWRDLRRRRS